MLYDILKDFHGSQDGRITEFFPANTQAHLSDYLAEIVVNEGWAKPAKSIEVQNKAIVTSGRGKKHKESNDA